jgi:phosphoglycolate phosphatase-like HAD superfamily hydrolase
MRLRAIVFDVDGTLAETEREGHLPACNEAFATLGFPVRWNYTFGEPFAGAALTAPSLELFDLDRRAALCLPEAEAAARA